MPMATVIATAAQVGGVEQGRAGGVQLAEKGIAVLPPKVVWKAPGVVGKLEDRYRL